MSSYSVSVLIPTFRRLDMLRKCLAGIEQLDPAPAEIIVVCRPAADPETATWLRGCGISYPSLKIVEVIVGGQVAALNVGIEHAGGDIIAILDDDAVPRAEWLRNLIVHFQDECVGAVGGRDYVHGQRSRSGTRRSAGVRNLWGEITGHHDVVEGPAREVLVLKGCNFAVRRAAIGTLRFDTRLPGKGAQLGNDWWFCLNLGFAGWKVILDPFALVDHFPGEKSEYDRYGWCRAKCHDWAMSTVATELAFAPWHVRMRFYMHWVLVGYRFSPGLYFIAHSLAKRPRSLPVQLLGGWTGFFDGHKLLREFERNLPGLPAKPPAKETQGVQSSPNVLSSTRT